MDKPRKEHDPDKARRWVEESNITRPSEQKKEWYGLNEGKQDLERARLQQLLERSCWKINNEKNKLDMVLWNTSQIMR